MKVFLSFEAQIEIWNGLSQNSHERQLFRRNERVSLQSLQEH